SQDDGAGGRTIDVKVPHANPFLLDPVLPIVEAFKPRSQSVARGIHQVDRLVKVLRAHHPQHGPEEFGEMRDAAGLDAPFDAGTYKVRVTVDVEPRHHGPRLAIFEFLERPLQLAAWGANEGAHLRRQIPRRADAQAFYRVAKGRAEL